MRLIIAEKHSVGQAIAQAVGGHMEKHDGYVQVGDDLVTWAQGHLVDLAAPDEYKNHDWGKWSLDTLPIDPTPDWQWKVSRDKGADRQYKVVAGLMRRGDVDMLVDACDPDREGEAIFRRIVTHVGVSKPMRRLWVANLANTMSAQLDFVNQAGGRNSVKVSILEKDKLMQLAQNIQRLVFADVEGQRHQESKDMAQKQYTAQTNSVLIQQQMLDQQRKATADDNPSMPTE